MLKPLLIEIGVEELPAIPFLKELPNIEKKWNDILEKNSLECEFNFYYTPRRLVLWHREFPTKQQDKIEEVWGAPKAIAEKNPKAVEGFAKKNGISIDEVTFKTKGNQEFLYIKKEIKGKSSAELIPQMIDEFLDSLNFGKSMRWGDKPKEFIRPIRWITAILKDEVISFESLYGVKSCNFTYGHRNYKEPIFIDFVGTYFCQLDKHGVILYQDERRKIILDGIKKIEQNNNVKVEIDEKLLEEIVTITEYPTPLLGSFEDKFLELPPEVIITSMKEHQRYFPVYKDDKLANNFIVVSNAKTDDFSQVVAGNEKVLRARLSDALFFWENDLKNGFNIEGLKDITYMAELGSVYDKEVREAKIAEILAEKFDENKELINRAIMLSKADLLTEMVFEFTELQGIMGYYYALKFGEDEKVAIAIKEQYSNSASNKFSAIVSLAIKLDTLMSLFSIGKLPKGNRDPFGLRRAAIAIINLIKEHNLDLDLKELIDKIKGNYKEFDTQLVIDFILDRLYQIYKDVNPSVIKAVLASGDTNIVEIDKKIKALNEIVNSDDFDEVFTTFKRVANIVKDYEVGAIDEKLLNEEAEKKLFEAYKEKSSINGDYLEKMDALFSLKPEIDNFFDNVMVNVDDEKLKTNRKNLIGNIYKSFSNIADIKEITI
ncbi:MAG: glycine--tRNA ligase subunit beta [Nautilia sp.]|nr:MAG: glycine--tRNA ligase subunit beta [Nautilia sp.]